MSRTCSDLNLFNIRFSIRFSIRINPTGCGPKYIGGKAVSRFSAQRSTLDPLGLKAEREKAIPDLRRCAARVQIQTSKKFAGAD